LSSFAEQVGNQPGRQSSRKRERLFKKEELKPK
jgi:hypothetical protein